MAGYCVNRSSKEFKTLAEQTDMHPIELAARVSLWQESNGTEKFPELKDLDMSTTKRIQSLLDKSIEEQIFTLGEVSESASTSTESDYASNMDFLTRNDKDVLTVDEVFDNMLNSNRIELSENAEFLVDKINRLSKKSNAKVRVISEDAMQSIPNSEGALMAYDGNTNSILIVPERLQDSSIEDVTVAFIHEAVHSVTYNVYKNPKTFEEQEFKRLIDEQLEVYKNKMDSAAYGLSNPYEFIAELFANPEFQEELRQAKNLWEEILDAIRRLFGMAKTDATTELMDVAMIQKRIEDVFDTNFKGDMYESFDFDTATSEVLFKKKEEKEESPDKQYYKLTKIEDRVTLTLNRMKDTVENNIKIYEALQKRTKNTPVEQKRLKAHTDKLKDILADLNKTDGVTEIQRVVQYTKNITKDIFQLEGRLSKENFQDKEVMRTISLYSKYLGSFALIKSVSQLTADIKANDRDALSEEEWEDIQKSLVYVRGEYEYLKDQFNSYMKKALKSNLSQLKYASEVETKWRNRLSQDYKALGIKEDKEVWIAKQINGKYREQIQEEVEEYISNLIDSPAYDITSATTFFNSSLNTNSQLVQIFEQMLGEIKNEMISKTREKDEFLQQLFNKLVAEKGSSAVLRLYKNILDQDRNGNYYLKGDYKLEFFNENAKLVEAKLEAQKEYGVGTPQYEAAVQAHVAHIAKKESYKNTFSELSETEKEVLAAFKDIVDYSNKVTFGQQSLKINVGGVTYYKLPSVTKSDLERILGGDVKGVAKDKYHDLTQIRPDDVDFVYKTDSDYNPLHNINIRYRGKLEPKTQSLDLFTIFRLEYTNGLNYETKHERELELNAFVEMAKNKDYYRTEGTRNKIKSLFIERNKIATKPGTESNTYRRLQGMIESQIYDVTHKYAGSIGGADVNKVVKTINGMTASIGLSVNRFAATANVMNANAQLFLEGIAGDTIKFKDLAAAEKYYFANMGESMNDLGRTVDKGKVNQILRFFDAFGFSPNSDKAFLQNGFLKSHANGGSLQFMHKMGEHWVQSSLTLAVLNGIKVMDKDNNYINKEGKVVKDSKSAASLLDMMEKDDNGLIRINPAVVYTTHTMAVEINKGGIEQIQALVKKKILDTMGNYDPNMQPEAMRHVWGKAVLMFRRFFTSIGFKRYRGFLYSLKSTDKIAEDPDKYQFYSAAQKEYIEGTYTSLLRFVRFGLIDSMKQMQFSIASKEWDKLSSHQKANIRHATAEMVLSNGILYLATVLLSGLAGGEDDDMVYFWLYQLRRLDTELSQYTNPSESFKMMRSPVPSMRILESSIETLTRTLAFWDWDETYLSGSKEGVLKVQHSWEKMFPVINQIRKDSKDLYDYQNNYFGIK